MNEYQYAKDIAEGSAVLADPFEASMYAARYLVQSGMDKTDAEARVRKLMEPYEKSLPEGSSLFQRIPTYVSNGDKFPLNRILSVPIYSSEIEMVGRLKDRDLECFLFTCVALARFEMIKSEKSKGFIAGSRWKEVAERANLSLSKKRRTDMVRRLYEAGMVEYGDGCMNLSARPLIFSPEGNVAIHLINEDFQDLGYAYRAFKGENFSRCCECGRWMPQTKNRNRIYCSECLGDGRSRYFKMKKREERKRSTAKGKS